MKNYMTSMGTPFRDTEIEGILIIFVLFLNLK